MEGVMLKKVISLFSIVLFSTTFSISFATSKSYQEHVPGSKNHPLKKLMIEKKAFDEICNSIADAVANFPECNDCPDAKQEVISLRNAKNKLEKINNNLLIFMPNIDELEPNEKAAALLIYKSIASSAKIIKNILKGLVDTSKQELYINAQPPGNGNQPDWSLALVTVAGVVAAGVANSGRIGENFEFRTCDPLFDEDECWASGCWWVTEYEAFCVNSDPQIEETCCEYITDNRNCEDSGCVWKEYEDRSYCMGGP